MTTPAFKLSTPRARNSSVIFASPHSGRDYPWSFLSSSVLDEHTIRSSEDAFVEMLFGAAPRFGAPLLAANYPRAFVDLNRSQDELDPALIEGLRRQSTNPRVASGLGVIPRVVSNGRSIYRGRLTRQEADQRLTNVWQPYHQQLQALISESHRLFGEAILIDCHSMPHEAIESIGQGSGMGPDVVLGDRFGAAANGEIVDRVESAFASAGFEVARNAPFAGAYTAQHYGRPSRNQHVVQVEIDRSLYMDEATILPNGDFAEFRSLMTKVAAEIASVGRQSVPLAAE